MDSSTTGRRKRRSGVRRTAQSAPDKVREFLDAVPDMMFRVTRAGLISDFKPGSGIEPEIRPEAVLMRRLGDVLPEDVAPSCEAAVTRAFDTGQPQFVEFRLPRRGDVRYYEARVVRLDSGDVLAIVRDITRRVPGDLEESRVVLEALPDMLLRVSRDGRFLDFKPARDFEPFVPPAEFLGRRVTEVLPETVASRIMPHIERAIESGVVQTYEYELPLSDGPHRYEARIVPLGEDDVLAIVRDAANDAQGQQHVSPSTSRLRNAYSLTAREMAVLRLVTVGMTDKEVANRLHISPMTARRHIANIRRKMGAVSRTDASVRAVREGLLT